MHESAPADSSADDQTDLVIPRIGERGGTGYHLGRMQSRPCPGCESDQSRVVATLTARQIIVGNGTYSPDSLDILQVQGDDRFAFAECAGCGFLFAAEEPSASFLTALYARAIDGERARNESQRPQWVAHQFQLAAPLLARFSTPVTILDYGCGYGTLLRALSGPAVRSIGFEPSETVVRNLVAQGLDASSDLESVRRRGPYDGIILSDVLEHVPRPRQVLEDCHGMLRDDGWIAVSVPDFSPRRRNAVLSEVRRGASAPNDFNPWEHLNYFSPRALSAMLNNAGFAVDPFSSADFGLRNEAGIRRWGNAIKAAIRLLQFAARPKAMTTAIVAQRKSTSKSE